MPISAWSTTAALNVESTGVSGTGGGVGIQGTNLPSNFDNALRDIMAQIATFVTASTFTGTTPLTLTSTDAGAAAGPILTFYRNSATPAAADIAGKILFQGEDSAGNTEDYAEIYQVIDDATSTSEDASLLFRTKIAGTMSTQFTLSAAGMTMNQSLILKAGTAPTVEGAMEWNSTTNAILVGDAAATKTFRANSWETISETAFSATASFTATGLSAYRKLRISGFLIPATDAQALFLRTDTNNGASPDAGASDYNWQYLAANAAAVVSADSGNTTEIRLNGSITIGNATGEGISFTIDIHEFNQAQYAWLNGATTMMRDTGIMYTGTISGRRLQATARDAIEIKFGSGNIASGHLVLEGVRG